MTFPTLTLFIKEHWRSLKIAAWLGWQIESNWTDPFLFAVYSLVKPLASVLILVVMYGVITKGNFDSPLFAYMYIGNAFYMYVGRMLNGMAWAIIDDREHYKTLKYVYTAPIHFPTYLFGRSIASFLVATISVTITLLAGVLFFNLPIRLTQVDWFMFIVGLVVGINLLAIMGLILSGVLLLLAHHMWGIGEAVAGSLYLFSGAIFPLTVLPPTLRWLGYIMPVTYWLELMRRSLVGSVASAYPTFTNLSDLQILMILFGLTVVFALIGAFSFGRCEQKARDLGMIDVVTNY